MTVVTEVLYLIAAALFILALRWMSQPDTARRAVAAAVTRHAPGGRRHACSTRTSSPTSGLPSRPSPASLLGVPLARVPLTAVPERTGLSQAFGGLAAGLVGTAKYYLWLSEGQLTPFPHGRRRRQK